MQTLNDNDLVRRIVDEQSEPAGTELFRRYRKKVYIWCFGVCHDRDEAVDLTQEVFIRIFRGLAGFDGRSGFSTWVYRITRNHCLSVVSSRREKWRRNLAQLEEFEPPDYSLVEELRQAEITGQVDRLLLAAGQVMKDDELEAFILHYRDGLTVKEISRTLGCTNATGARTLIQNARRKFRRLVDRKDRTSEQG